jgi:hypothetical protein
MATSSVEEREVKIRMRKPLNAAFIQDTLSVLHNLTPEPHQPSSNMSQGNSRTSIVRSNPFILLHAVQKMPRRGCTWWTSFASVAVEFPASSQKQGQKFLRLTSYLACRSRSGNFWKYWSCSPVRSRFLSRLCGIFYCNNRNVSQKSAD